MDVGARDEPQDESGAGRGVASIASRVGLRAAARRHRPGRGHHADRRSGRHPAHGGAQRQGRAGARRGRGATGRAAAAAGRVVAVLRDQRPGEHLRAPRRDASRVRPGLDREPAGADRGDRGCRRPAAVRRGPGRLRAVRRGVAAVPRAAPAALRRAGHPDARADPGPHRPDERHRGRHLCGAGDRHRRGGHRRRRDGRGGACGLHRCPHPHPRDHRGGPAGLGGARAARRPLGDAAGAAGP